MMKQHAVLGWIGVAIAAISLVLISHLILYPKPTAESILAALRFSSFTTAGPFLLVFAAKPIAKFSRALGQWVETHHKELWMILTISHFLHLYQIYIFYQLGQSCPGTVWAVTAPLWIFMLVLAGRELRTPQVSEPFDIQATLPENRSPKNTANPPIYEIGIWYIWLIFTLAFGLSAVARHIPFYPDRRLNTPIFSQVGDEGRPQPRRDIFC